MSERVCDDVKYIHNERTAMFYIWVSNDDRYYDQPKRAAKYDFGRSADGEDRKQKLAKGIYREPYLDGWKYTINEKVHPTLVETTILYAKYGRYEDEDGNRIVFTYLRHNRKALGIHYMLERAVKCYNTRRYEDPWYCSDFYLKPYFPTPEKYDGYNPCGFRDYSRRMKNY